MPGPLIPIIVGGFGAFFSAIAGYIGFKFVKKGVRARVIGSIIGAIIAISAYIIIKLLEIFVFN